jgi:predicted esterase
VTSDPALAGDEASSRASALSHARQDGTAGADLPVVVVLHDRGGDAVSAAQAARARFGRRVDVVAPQAARPCNPFQSNLQSEPGYAGFSWYLGDDAERPEAASFGDALAELESFVTELARPFVLTGAGQGAILAMTLALHALPNLRGVWCEGAALALLDGWQPPELPLGGVAFVVESLDDLRMSRVRDTLEARGARVGLAVDGPEAWLEAIVAEKP